MRQHLQIEVLKKANPDVAFFQEVNPVSRRAPQLGEALQMQNIFQPDLVGLKLFGLGLPLNLNSGLAMLASKRLGVKWVEAMSLSRPGLNLVHSWGSWQLKEERFALFGETMIPKWGRVLMVNTHLHHGLELTADFQKHIEELGQELDLPTSMMSELIDRLQQANQRREHEMKVLLERLKTHESRYEVVLLGGDFNASPASELSQLLKEHGFRDTWAEANPNDPGYSYDSQANAANHLLQSRFPLSLMVEDLTFSTEVKDSMLKLARAQENRPRRIDYFFVKSKNVDLKVKSAELIGHPGPEGLAPSDHFGLLVDIELD